MASNSIFSAWNITSSLNSPLPQIDSDPLVTSFTDDRLAQFQQVGLDRGQTDFVEFVAGLRDEIKQQGGLHESQLEQLYSRLREVLAKPPLPRDQFVARPAPAPVAPAAPASNAQSSAPAPGLTAAAQELQLPLAELNDMLATGQSLADIAQRRGISVDAVTNAVRSGLAADRPTLTNAQLDEFTEGLMNHRADPLQAPALAQGSDPSQPAPGITAAAQELQLPVSELNDMLAAGQSLTDIAQRRGISVDTVTNAVRSGLAADRPNLTSAQLDLFTDGLMHRRADPLQLPPGQHARTSQGITAAARELELSPGELNAMLSAGLSIGDVAQRRGISIDSVTAAVRNGLAADRPDLTPSQLDLLTDGLVNRRLDPQQALKQDPAPIVPARRFRPFIAP